MKDIDGPMARAFDLLEHRYRYPIAFEDTAPYERWEMRDFVGSIDPKVRANMPSLRESLRPFGSLNVDLSLPSDAATPAGIHKILDDLVEQHFRNTPRKFKVLDRGVALALVLEGRRNEKGEYRPVISPLDLPISFPEADRSTDDALSLIIKEVSAIFGAEIINTSNPLKNKVVRLGANQEPAREVLVRLIKGTHESDPERLKAGGVPGDMVQFPRWSWTLIHVRDTNVYSFYLRPVDMNGAQVERDLGSGKLKTVPRPTE
jgi:hypothetical protein